ncbi:hypothetical protein CAPTEDRAFT_223722 [Capitella teleta]|uniref:Cytoplasmic tRNA 2-thiolation protein 2 n=1 Tax=Capitella teleta TaxID=283909 RepID=R7U248_CAPTE|nr:hypothetical protein CAPTEDRAFT_223722 [Capitella teleta]|eukprot:ELT99947.1 hypothetical protein CAPTEDRAFT_223722 [Capitella teleta]
MCSIQEGELLQPKRQPSSSLRDRKCMKCSNEETVVIIRINDAFCKDCFLQYCTHKFRSAFGKSRLIRDKEQVLVAHSGGPASCAMLHLIQEGTSRRAHKKLRFSSVLVFIDDGVFHGLTLVERKARNAQVLKQLISSGLDVHAYAIEQVMSTTSSASLGLPVQAVSADSFEILCSFDSECKQLEALLAATTSDTSRQSLQHVLRQRLLIQVANGMGINKVLLGNSTTSLAVQMMSNVAQGRGAHLLYDMSFADLRSTSVTFVRPMREFTTHEIEHYLLLNQLGTIDVISTGPKGLEGLTSDFVLGLQADFPNTVSTIMRTGEKIGVSHSEIDIDLCCSLCQAPLDTDVGPSSALAATQFSEVVSRGNRQSSRCSSEATECCGQGDGSCQSSTRCELPDLRRSLCYGCRLMCKDLKDTSLLPASVQSNALQVKNRAEMRASIQNFLIEDDDAK